VTTAVAQWVVTGYAIAFGGLLILGGRAADLLGRRRMFIASPARRRRPASSR
jgi:MFS family permease